MSIRHLLTLKDLNKAEFHKIIKRGIELKKICHNNEVFQPFIGKTLTMIFEKSSTRTRLSFEVGMAQFGGHAIFLSTNDSQLGRGEPIEDSARVISSMTDIVMIRTFEHEKLTTFAEHSSVPVINGLTDDFHPCQLLADMMAFWEKSGDISGKTVTWIGDGNNMCHSYILAADILGFHLNICTPVGFEPSKILLDTYQQCVTLFNNKEEAVNNSSLVVTDVWASMGQEGEQAERLKSFKDLQVNEALLDKANDDVLFMHCLPAHRGEEISETLFDDERSVVWCEAENRLHAQKALIEMLLNQ